MKTRFVLTTALAGLFLLMGGATQKAKSLKQVAKFTLSAGSGTNGAGITYNPDKKVYYAAMAGNTSYPIYTLDKKGKELSNITAGVDTRGIWYNSKNKRIEINPYNVFSGYWYYSINANGHPFGVPHNIFTPPPYEENEYQPDDQSVGAYLPESNEIVFFHDQTLYYYNQANGKLNKTARINNIGDYTVDYNTTTVVYTGIKSKEFAIFDHQFRTIYLINKQNHNISAQLNLPKKSPNPNMFNFAYCNKMYWLFDKDERTWYGYK